MIGAVLLIPLALPSLLAFDSSHVTVRGVVGLGYLVVVTSVVMMLLWNGMLRHLEPVQFMSETTNPLSIAGRITEQKGEVFPD